MADYTISPAEVKVVGTPVTDTRFAGTGLTIVAGEPLYIDAGTDTFLKATASGTVEASTATHIALNGGGEGQPIQGAQMLPGLIMDLGAGAAIAATALLMVSANAGRFAPPVDLATGNWSTYCATGIGNNQVRFGVNASGAQVP